MVETKNKSFKSLIYWKITDDEGWVVKDRYLYDIIDRIVSLKIPIKIVLPEDHKYILKPFLKKIIP